MNTSTDYRRHLTTTRAGGGVIIRHDADGFLEINADAVYALRAIAIERARLSAQLDELEAADLAIRAHYREVFT